MIIKINLNNPTHVYKQDRYKPNILRDEDILREEVSVITGDTKLVLYLRRVWGYFLSDSVRILKGNYPRVPFPKLRKVFPEMISRELVSVQPMSDSTDKPKYWNIERIVK